MWEYEAKHRYAEISARIGLVATNNKKDLHRCSGSELGSLNYKKPTIANR